MADFVVPVTAVVSVENIDENIVDNQEMKMQISFHLLEYAGFAKGVVIDFLRGTLEVGHMLMKKNSRLQNVTDLH